MSDYKLVDAYQDGYVADLAATEESIAQTEPEILLEKIETFHDMGFDANAEKKITELEANHDINFAELAEKAGVDI